MVLTVNGLPLQHLPPWGKQAPLGVQDEGVGGGVVGTMLGVMLEQYCVCQLLMTEQGIRLELVAPKTFLEVFWGNLRATIRQTKEKTERTEARRREKFFSFII